MKRLTAALVAGLLFGFGLSLARMTDRQRVLGFLDVAGDWDPTLVWVLGGAVGTTLITFRLILRREQPLLDAGFHLPTRTHLDRSLLIGASLFGIGWGIAGYCPGPGIAALGIGLPNAAVFVLALAAGSFLPMNWARDEHPGRGRATAPKQEVNKSA